MHRRTRIRGARIEPRALALRRRVRDGRRLDRHAHAGGRRARPCRGGRERAAAHAPAVRGRRHRGGTRGRRGLPCAREDARAGADPRGSPRRRAHHHARPRGRSVRDPDRAQRPRSDRLYAALTYEGFAVNRYFADDLATEDAAAPYRRVFGSTVVAAWVDAAAMAPERDVSAYDRPGPAPRGLPRGQVARRPGSRVARRARDGGRRRYVDGQKALVGPTTRSACSRAATGSMRCGATPSPPGGEWTSSRVPTRSSTGPRRTRPGTPSPPDSARRPRRRRVSGTRSRAAAAKSGSRARSRSRSRSGASTRRGSSRSCCSATARARSPRRTTSSPCPRAAAGSLTRLLPPRSGPSRSGPWRP